jgi:hypothetical protein
MAGFFERESGSSEDAIMFWLETWNAYTRARAPM